LGVCSHIQP